jgi:hypothetical protein
MERRKPRVLLLLALLAVSLAYGLYARTSGRPAPPSFSGESSALKRTQVVATLDAPVTKGRNVIWCASFQVAWKKLEQLAGGPVKLKGAGATAEALNRAADPTKDAPAGSLYAASGFVDKGILTQIARDVKRLFPGSAPPTFPGIIADSFVAYSRLEARAKFTIPYFQSTKPLAFTSADGTKANVSSFGLREEDKDAYPDLHAQPRLLYSNARELMQSQRPVSAGPSEFIIDLDGQSQPSQIVLAMVEPGATLADTLATVEKKISGYHGAGDPAIGTTDILLVPEVVWSLTHHFSELEGKRTQNPALRGLPMDVAQEDMAFRLDRYGAELRAEAKMYAQSMTRRYVFDHPFLIIMRTRGATRPYFVMWVDNAELLTKMR